MIIKKNKYKKKKKKERKKTVAFQIDLKDSKLVKKP